MEKKHIKSVKRNTLKYKVFPTKLALLLAGIIITAIIYTLQFQKTLKTIKNDTDTIFTQDTQSITNTKTISTHIDDSKFNPNALLVSIGQTNKIIIQNDSADIKTLTSNYPRFIEVPLFPYSELSFMITEEGKWNIYLKDNPQIIANITVVK